MTSTWDAATPLKIVSSQPYGSFFTNSWKPDDKIFSVYARYSCIFPRQVLYETAQFVSFQPDDECFPGEFWIPIDFISYVFALRPLLLHGFANLLPRRINNKIHAMSHETEHIYRSCNVSPDIEIPTSGVGLEALSTARKLQPSPEFQILQMPWLIGARLEDFIEVVQDNPNEFRLYAESLRVFLQRKQPDLELILDWIKDVSIASIELDIKLKNKKRELTAKGFDVALGTICTIASLLVPNMSPADKSALAALLGGKTAYDGLRWIYDYRQSRDLLSHEKHWLLWRVSR